MTDNDTAPMKAMVAGFANGDLDAVLAVFDDNIVYEDVPFGVRVEGKQTVAGFCGQFMAAVPDFRQELTACSRMGDTGCMEWVMSFTHSGDLPGLPATGKHFTVRGMTAVELRGDKIVRSSSYYDLATVLRLAGALPPLPEH